MCSLDQEVTLLEVLSCLGHPELVPGAWHLVTLPWPRQALLSPHLSPGSSWVPLHPSITTTGLGLNTTPFTTGALNTPNKGRFYSNTVTKKLGLEGIPSYLGEFG